MKGSRSTAWSCSCFWFLEILAPIRRLFMARQDRASSPPPPPQAVEAAVAREGRHRQRYDGCYRLVAGCIPYNLKENSGESGSHDYLVDRLQVLMVSTPKRDDLIFPKGGWENDESADEAACREAFEEAGVKGILNETPLGEWIFKSKSKQKNRGLEGACKGYMFALQVTELLDSWPEQISHGRRWVSMEDAYGLCRYEWMREALNKLQEHLLFRSSSNFMSQPPPELPAKSNLYMVVPAAAEGAVALC